MKTILLVDDFYGWMINGVTTVINNTITNLEKKGYNVKILYPEILSDRNIYNPSYYSNEIDQLVLESDYIHILSEERLGEVVQESCKKFNKKFTTSIYTKFPEYLEEWKKKFPDHNRSNRFSSKQEYQNYMTNFHKDSSRVMVPTNSMKLYASSMNIPKTYVWTIGVDTGTFKPVDRTRDDNFISCVYYGRVTTEKNIDSFLEIDDPKIKKTIIGPKEKGYTREYLESLDIRVIGKVSPTEAALELPKHDVLVFPSHTDTFGLVMLEAMACGLPVAAFPNDVVSEVIENGVTGIMDNSLKNAIYKANELDRSECIKRANKFSWTSATDQFLKYLVEST